MKHRSTFHYLLPVLMLIVAVGCNPQKPPRDASEIEKPIAFVSILPIQFLVDQIAADHIETEVMVRPGFSPATYEPLPSQVAQLSKAQLFFTVGQLGFETAWRQKLAESNPQMKIVTLSDGIQLLEGGHVHHDGESHDPHIWVAPAEIKVVIGNITNALAEFDTVNADNYRNNSVKLLQRVDSLEKELQLRLEPRAGSNIYIFHPALGYLAKQYNLNQISIEHEGKEPTPRMIQSLIASLKKESNPTILVQQEFDKKHAEVIAKGSNARLVDIYPLKYDWFEMMDELSRAVSGE